MKSLIPTIRPHLEIRCRCSCDQGDQNVRFCAHWVIVYIGQFFITEESLIFGPMYSNV
jgi:hypothetical protein